MQKKYTVLRIVSTVFKVLAWIILVVGVLGACASIAAPLVSGVGSRSSLGLGANTLLVGIAGGIGAIIGSLIAFLVLYAYGDLIHLLIALEENTRTTAERLLSKPA